MFAEARAFHSANAAPGLTIAAVKGGQSRPRVKRRRAAVPEALSDDETKPMKRDTQGFFEQIEQPHPLLMGSGKARGGTPNQVQIFSSYHGVVC
jgi:hypothetical protein